MAGVTSWRWVAAALLAACVDNTGPGTDTEATGASSGQAPTEPGCMVDADCPGQSCRPGVCEAGVCGLADAPADSEDDDDPGNCQRVICDGKGGSTPFPDDSDAPFDTPRDCKQQVCEGGAVVFVTNDLDLPDDFNDCTEDACVLGVPEFAPRPVNSSCGPDAAGFCHEDGECEPCEQVTDACKDGSGTEPNDGQSTAHALGEVDDDDASAGFVCGVLQGKDDVDWFKFVGRDALFNYVDPTRELLGDPTATICVYLQCLDGGTSVDCDAGDTPDTSPLGHPGCCGAGMVSPGLDCDGLDDSANVWVKVVNSAALECVGYQLTYHF
jgi:hypothetical protein